MPHYFNPQRLWLAGLALAGCHGLIACGSLSPGDATPTFRDPSMSMQNARDAIVVGVTTQAQTKAALGPATEIRFDSGYAIWVYRARAADSGADRAEFVILFTPSGIAKKTRLGPSYTTTGK